MNSCPFCLRSEPITEPFCKENPGKGCTYGLDHEFPVPIQVAPVKREKKPDRALCLKCGLHPKNPAYAGNGCEHEHAV